jgi:Flp pilus assembly protein TadG
MRACKNTKTPVRRGTAAVELAVLAPFLVFLMVIAVDWARVFYYTVTINDCARNGAIYLYDSTNAGTTISPYTGYSQAALAGTNLSPTPTVSSNSGTDATNGDWVECTVSYPFKTLTNFPGVPHNTTVRRTIRMSKASKLPTS